MALAQAGAAVAVNYRARSSDADAVVEAVGKQDGRAAAFCADVSLSASVQSMVRDVEQRLGPIDILINNAGMAATRGLDDITEEDFDRAIATNLKSAFLCTQAVLPACVRAAGAGSSTSPRSALASAPAPSASLTVRPRQGSKD